MNDKKKRKEEVNKQYDIIPTEDLTSWRGASPVTTKIVANSHVQFDTCTVSYTCQTFRHVHFDTRITRVKPESHKLHNLTRVLEYTCQI
jgi:hypothetical protein